MDVVTKFMQADLSFAGVGAYYRQTPMKTFKGEELCIPASVVADALDSMQKGSASPRQKDTSKGALKIDPCMKGCLDHVQSTCTQILNSNGGHDKQQQQAADCMNWGREVCKMPGVANNHCPSVAGGGGPLPASSTGAGKGKM